MPEQEKVITQEKVIANPVLKPDHVQISKDLFNQAMADQGLAPGGGPLEAPPEPEATKPLPVKPKEPKSKPNPVEPKPEVEPAPAKEEKKSVIPSEILEPQKQEEPKTDEAITKLDAMVLKENAKPQAVADFNELRSHAKKVIEERNVRITELERQVDNGANKSQLESLQKQVADATKRAEEAEQNLERAAFTESPRFKSQFVEAGDAALAGARSYLEGTEINPRVIDLAAHATGQERRKILNDAGIESDLTSLIAPYLTQYDNIQSDRLKATENWQAESERYRNETQARLDQHAKDQMAQEERVWSDVVSGLNLLPFRKTKDNDQWNSQVDALLNKAKNSFNGQNVDLKEIGERLLKGYGYDVVSQYNEELLAQNKELKAENAKLTAVKPGGGQTVTGGGLSSGGPEETDEQRRKREFNEQMALAGAR